MVSWDTFKTKFGTSSYFPESARAATADGVLSVGVLMSDSETLTVERARNGDRAAFEDLVRRTSRLVFARIYLECGDAGRAEDLLQETYLLALRSIRGLTDAAAFRSW